jgi:uncharacterized protein (DUF433 family)
MDFVKSASADDFKQIIVADTGEALAYTRGQFAWGQMMSIKFAEFDYEALGQEMLALKWHPAGRDSKVVIDPRVSFGAPTVNGVPTWSLKGRYEAGESLEDIIEDFQISKDDALDALNFEGIQIAA